jgi:crossover junction endodeoxyribonuclease RuvC
LDGAFAFVTDDGAGTVFRTPTLTTTRSGKTPKGNRKTKREYALAEITDLLRRFAPTIGHVYVELVASMPGQGVRSMFSLGYGLAVWETALTACGIPFTRVTPQSWKKAMLHGVGTDKRASILRAQQLFPTLAVTRDGPAEALLLAEHCRRQSR